MLRPGHLHIGDLLDGKHLGVELRRPVHVADGHTDRRDRLDTRLGGRRTDVRLVGYPNPAAQGQGQAKKDDGRSIEWIHITDLLTAIPTLRLRQSTALTSSISVPKPSASVGWV